MKRFNYNAVKIKDKDGNWTSIPALRGANMYTTAVEYGFEGTEEDWFKLITGKDVTPDIIGAADIRLTNVDKDDFTAKAIEAGFATSAVLATHTTFNEDGSITEIDDTGIKTTTFNEDGSVTEFYDRPNGEQITKVTTFNEDGSIHETVTVVTEEASE